MLEFLIILVVLKPSKMSISFNWAILLLLTDPPYKIIGDFLPNLFLIKETDFNKSSDLGIRPVPIDHTGS